MESGFQIFQHTLLKSLLQPAVDGTLFVYRLTNVHTNSFYIGIARSIINRSSEHLRNITWLLDPFYFDDMVTCSPQFCHKKFADELKVIGDKGPDLYEFVKSSIQITIVTIFTNVQVGRNLEKFMIKKNRRNRNCLNVMHHARK